MTSSTRYTADQLAEAITRSARGGDPRFFLISGLISLCGEQAETEMRRLVDGDRLTAGEWYSVMVGLTRCRPAEFVPRLVAEGLTSRSIDVQQLVVAYLPEWALRELLNDELTDLVIWWLDRRMKNPRRQATLAGWEIPDIGRAVLATRGPEAAYDLLVSHRSRMDAHEQRELDKLPQPDSDGFAAALAAWDDFQSESEDDEEVYADPTATRYIDRVMRRLKIDPANPDVEVFVEDWETFEPL